MRHRERHIHATIVKYLTQVLTDNGWVNAPVNFGSRPVTILAYQPMEAGETPAPNTVAISMGDQGPQDAYEMGGLESVDYTLFVDVYGENIPVSMAIADDLKDALYDTWLPLFDFTHSSAGTPTDDELEFQTVLVEVVPTATTTVDKRTWRAVKATVVCYF